MMNKFSLLVVFTLLALTVWSQPTQRSVEVSGMASRKIKADQFTLSVGVISGGQCAVPSGKNYQKYIKECQESNKQLVASRENILKGILESYGDKIKLISRSELEYQNSLDYTLSFNDFYQVQDFVKKLDEYKNVFRTDIQSAWASTMTSEIYQEVRLESLLDARKKADAMAQALGEQLGMVLNIYESKPSNSGGWNDFMLSMMMMDESKGRTKMDNLQNGLSSMPDGNGFLTCTASSFVRFALK